MRFDDDDYGNSGGASILYMALGVSAFIFLVMGVVLYVNKKDNHNSNYAKFAASTQAIVAEEVEPEKSKLTADDLDIWDMYPKDGHREEEEVTEEEEPTPTPIPTISPMTEEEKYNDGKHFKVDYSDGSSEWLLIDSKRERNNYDFTNLVTSDGKMKYYLDGKQTSFVGIDINRYQTGIDFNQVKNAGIDFVMIRVGARGYQSGQISLDENFETNIRGAQEAGLDVGVYFYSQAANAVEATEEANLVKLALTNYKITYPVAYDMELVPNDVSRIDNLTRDERSVITATFINAIAAAGYKTLIYGNEEWLVKKINLVNMPSINVWLADESDMPDYPYPYSMWQYTTKGSVVGINGNVNMDICFIDYRAQ